MNIFISDSREIIQNVAYILKQDYHNNDILLINDKNLILFIGDNFYSINTSGVGNKLLEIRPKATKKIVVAAHISNYQYINNLQEALNSIGDNHVNIINMCRCSGKGEVNFRIIKTVIKKKEVSYKRVWFETQTKKDIIKALENVSDDRKYSNLGDYYLADKVVDIYGKNRVKKVVEDFDIQLNLKEIFLIKLLKKRDEKIERFKRSMYYKIKIAYEGIDGIYLDKSDNDRFRNVDEVIETIEKFKDSSLFVSRADVKNIRKNHPLLCNQADIINYAISYSDIDTDECIKALNTLYYNAYITNPNTTSKHIKANTGENVIEILKAIKNIDKYKIYIKYLKEVVKEIKITNRIANEKHVDENEAIIPTFITPGEESPLTPEENFIYDIIVRKFLSCFMGDYIGLKVKVNSYIGEGRVVTDNEYVINHGFYIVNYKSEEVEQIIKDLKERKDFNTNIKKGDIFKPTDFLIKKGKNREPGRYRTHSLIKSMSNFGKQKTNEKDKIEERDVGIGNPEEREIVINDLFNKEIVTTDENKVYIYLTDTGNALAAKISDSTIDIRMLRKTYRLLANIRRGKKDIEEGLVEIINGINFMLTKIPQDNQEILSVDYERLSNKIKCPICESKMYDRGTFIGCKDYSVCKFIIPKIMSRYVLSEEDIFDMCKTGRTKLIEDFIFKNNKKGKAYLQIDRKKRRVVYDFNIIN